MVNIGSRKLGLAGILAAAILLGCAPAPRPSGMITASRAAGTLLSSERAAGSVVIVLPSRALVESEVRGASGDHRPGQIALDIDRTEAETLQLARSSQASRLFDKVSVVRSDQPQDEAIGNNDYKIWAQMGSESFLWHLDDPRGDRAEIAFDQLEDFPDAAFDAVHRLGGRVREGVGAPMIHVGDNRVFQVPITPKQEDVFVEIHDDLPTEDVGVFAQGNAFKVFKKYEALIDDRARLYCPNMYSKDFNYIGKRLTFPTIGCRVYCE